VNKHCIRMSIVALAAGAFGLISVAGSAQAVAASGSTASGSTVSTTTTISVPGTSVSLGTTVTIAPNDSSWD